MTHPDAIGGSYPERLAVHRATGQPKAVRAAQAWHKAHNKKKCQCGTCKTCVQRARRIEQKAKDEARIAGVVAADQATPKVKLSTSPEIAFLDRLLASEWKGVPSALLPPCVVAALQAWQEPPAPSDTITKAVTLWERIKIPAPVDDWADDWQKADYERRLANAERDMGAKPHLGTAFLNLHAVTSGSLHSGGRPRLPRGITPAFLQQSNERRFARASGLAPQGQRFPAMAASISSRARRAAAIWLAIIL